MTTRVVLAIISIISSVLLIFLIVYGTETLAGTLSCAIRTPSCLEGETTIWRMSGTSNAHAELPNQTNYTHLVCCSGVEGLGNSCSGTFGVALKLSSPTNAHVEQNNQLNYANNACISVPTGGSLLVGYQADNCLGFDTSLGSISGTTNAHLGDSLAYPTKICATAAGPVISVTITANDTISYGMLPAGGSRSTHSGDMDTTIIAQNDGTVTEIFNIRGQNTACPWTLAATVGGDQYVHQFCKTTDVSCTSPPANYTPLSTSYQTLYTGVATGQTRNFDLRIIVPNPSSCFTQQSVDVTIQAVQE